MAERGGGGPGDPLPLAGRGAMGHYFCPCRGAEKLSIERAGFRWCLGEQGNVLGARVDVASWQGTVSRAVPHIAVIGFDWPGYPTGL